MEQDAAPLKRLAVPAGLSELAQRGARLPPFLPAPFELAPAWLESSLYQQHRREIDVCMRVIGLQLQRRTKVSNRLLGLPLHQMPHAEIVVHERVARRQC